MFIKNIYLKLVLLFALVLVPFSCTKVFADFFIKGDWEAVSFNEDGKDHDLTNPVAQALVGKISFSFKDDKKFSCSLGTLDDDGFLEGLSKAANSTYSVQSGILTCMVAGKKVMEFEIDSILHNEMVLSTIKSKEDDKVISIKFKKKK